MHLPNRLLTCSIGLKARRGENSLNGYVVNTVAGCQCRTHFPQAWAKCEVGEYNLGSECLTSKKSKSAYREYLRNNPDFRKEIEDKIGDVLGLDDEALESGATIEAQAVATMDDDDVFTADADDTDVPLDRVIQESLQLTISQADLPSTNDFCVQSDAVVTGENGTLRGAGDIENIWAYNDNGVPWSEGNLADLNFDS
jgi:hypothetical protein